MTTETMKTQLPWGARIPKGYRIVPEFRAKQIEKLSEFVRGLENKVFSGIPYGDKETFEATLQFLKDLSSATGLGHVRSTAWAPVGTEPRPYTAEGYLCSTGRHFFITKQHGEYWAKHFAAHCCGPYKCHNCGRESEESNTYCLTCLAARDREAWEKAERVEAPEGAMIYADASQTFYRDLEDFLDHCAGVEVKDPYSLMPFICEFQEAGPPNLAESIQDEMYDEWEGEDWLDEIQEQLNEAFAKHKPGAWHPGNKVPILPTA